MPVVVKSGAKTIGTLKRRSKAGVNKVLAKQFRKENRVSVLKVSMPKKRRMKK